MSQPISSQETTNSEYSIPGSEHTGTGNEKTGAKNRGKDVAGKARRTVENAKERAEEGMDRAKRQASDTYYRAKAEASRAYEDGMDSVRSSFQQRPLAYAFGAFAAGILVGMLLPTSRPERRMFSNSSERVRQAGRDVAERGRESVVAATQAAEERIRGSQEEQGNNPSGA